MPRQGARCVEEELARARAPPGTDPPWSATSTTRTSRAARTKRRMLSKPATNDRCVRRAPTARCGVPGRLGDRRQAHAGRGHRVPRGRWQVLPVYFHVTANELGRLHRDEARRAHSRASVLVDKRAADGEPRVPRLPHDEPPSATTTRPASGRRPSPTTVACETVTARVGSTRDRRTGRHRASGQGRRRWALGVRALPRPAQATVAAARCGASLGARASYDEAYDPIVVDDAGRRHVE